MPRRGENIYKRKDGRWEGRILKPNGKYNFVYAKTYREVKEKQKNFKDNMRPLESRPTESDICAVELFERWLYGDIANQIKPSTYGNYFSCIQKYVIPFFSRAENKYITEQTAAQFSRFINDHPDISESYKRKLLTIFKSALRRILKGSAAYPSILESIMLPKAENTEILAFSISEQRLIENAAFHMEDLRALGIVLTFYTGIRLGELCALKWSDFDYDSGVMSVTKTVTRVQNFQAVGSKTTLIVGSPKSQKSRRKIPLPKFLLLIYEKYRHLCPDENLYLLSGSSTPIDPRAYQKLFKKVLAEAGVKDRKFHAIRHTFATRALELGVDIKTLSEILGHANVSITLNIYAHSLIEQKKIAMDKFNDLHFSHMEIAAIAVNNPVVNV